jgi:lipopolysaccharide transport system ATP-binding protein
MSDKQIAIKVENLGKRYRIGENTSSFKTIRDSISDGFKKGVRKVGAVLSGTRIKKVEAEIWAIKNVSFEINRGEIVGIIGRNGAGKSTLLKTLARITEPTTGYIDIYGRVGSLLEVGTGFNYELTGRENIFLSGSILGMRNAEIKRHFDEIVEFSEVEKFIDTPVKHYSSGMYLRLAFGVAAHLQPEILLVDEVLAVGDVAFQKKCLGKMGDVAKQGRTVLFVSHNMSAVQELCQRGILIDAGQMAYDGRISHAIAEYYKRTNELNADDASTDDKFKPLSVSNLKVNDNVMPAVKVGEAFDVSLNVKGDNVRNPSIFFVMENMTGQQIVHLRVNSRDLGLETINGKYTLKIAVPSLWLSPGMYSIYFKFIASAVNWSGRALSERIMLEVQGDFEGTGKTILNPSVDWSFTSQQEKAVVV